MGLINTIVSITSSNVQGRDCVNLLATQVFVHWRNSQMNSMKIFYCWLVWHVYVKTCATSTFRSRVMYTHVQMHACSIDVILCWHAHSDKPHVHLHTPSSPPSSTLLFKYGIHRHFSDHQHGNPCYRILRHALCVYITYTVCSLKCALYLNVCIISSYTRRHAVISCAFYWKKYIHKHVCMIP